MKFRLKRKKGSIPQEERQLLLALITSVYADLDEPPKQKPPRKGPTSAPAARAKIVQLLKNVS